MNTNADLAKWGEPPATPEEERLAALVHGVLEGMQRGEDADATSRPAIAETANNSLEPMADTIYWIQQLAASIGEYSGVTETGKATPSQISGYPDPFPGELRIVSALGEGAFGKVWLAEDLDLKRRIALKELKALDCTAMDRLRKEARLMSSVRHPNVVQIHALRQSDGDHYLFLEYVAGGSLAARLEQEGPLPWQRAARYVADAGEALLEVHKRGIIHRDIKPANILWDPDRDEAVLTDFGVSCRLAEPAQVAAGTLPYMAPEAFAGELTPAVDLFGLAATLFHLVTGSLAFPAQDIIGHVGQVTDGLPQGDPRFSGLPLPLEELIRSGLAAAPRDRPPVPDFMRSLRSTLNLLIADSMLLPAAGPLDQPPVKLSLTVLRDQHAMSPLRTGKPAGFFVHRDMKKVPPVPDRVPLKTGDRVRIQISADRAGYVTVFNVGPSGNLHLLYPDDSAGESTSALVQANRAVEAADVELTPPAGRERLVATWSRMPLPLHHVLNLSGQAGEAVSRPYRATRGMEYLQQTVRHLRREDWHAVVLELDHQD
jgi:hypothetical protein